MLSIPAPSHAAAWRLTPAVIALVLAACGGGGGSPAGAGPAGPDSRGTLSTSTVLTPATPAQGEFTASFSYTITPGTVLLGSYQAEVRFDPARVQFVSTDPAISGNRIPNVSGAASGTIGVAGASTQGFPDRLLFRGTFRALASGTTADSFVLTVHEAFDTSLADLVD
ncbi:MAG: hypothetical protein ABR599_07480 [Gemmatimonadota bacterium]